MNNCPVQSWRYRGQSFEHVELITEQHAVPTLPEILQNVLAGYGTGLNTRASVSEYDETDINLNLMDPLDREALRQSTDEALDAATRPSSAKPSVSQPTDSTVTSIKESTAGATPQPSTVAGNTAGEEPAGAVEKGA